MSNVSASATSGGVSMVGLLGVILVVLKLLGKIQISWLWALAPFWIPAAIGGTILLIIGIVLLVAYLKGYFS